MARMKAGEAAGAPDGAPATASLDLSARPTVADLHGDNHFAQVARKNWLSAKAPKVRPEVIKQELWDELEKVDFAYSALLVLENLQALERYLWPSFDEDASNYHALLVALMVNVKRRENLPSWGMYCALHLECDRSYVNVCSRAFRRQTRRVLVLLPPYTVHECGSLAAHKDPDPALVFRHRRVSVVGQRLGAQRVRPSGEHIDMAELAFGSSKGTSLRATPNAKKGMEGGKQAFRCSR